MARFTHTVQTMPVWKTGTMATDGTDTELVWVAADATNKEQVPLTGEEVILIWNTHGSTAYTWTVTSVKDTLGRTGDIGAIDIAAGKIHRFQPDSLVGFRQTNGMVYFEANNASVKFAVVRSRR